MERSTLVDAQGRHRRPSPHPRPDYDQRPTPGPPSVNDPMPLAPPVASGSTVASNIVMMTVANVAVPLCGLATAPLLARGLGVDDRGAVAAGTAPLLLAIAIGTFGLPEAITARTARVQALSRQALLSTLAAILALGVVLTLAAVLAAPALSRGNDQVRALIVDAIPFLTPCLMLTPIRAVAGALGRWKLVAAEQAIAAALRLVLITALFTTGHLTALTATIVTALPLLLGGVVYVALRSSTDEWLTRGPADFRGLLSFGSRIWAGYLGGIVLLRLDQLVMVPLSGEYQLGIYVVAVTVAEILLVITNAARDVTFASDSASFDDGRAAMTARLAGVACAVATAFTIAVGPFVVPLVFGPNFRPAVLVIDVLLLAIVVLTPGSVAGGVLIARGFPGRRSAAIVAGAVVNVALLLVLVPAHGAMGAAIATLVGNAVFGGLNLVFLRLCTGNKVTHFIVPRPSDIGVVKALAADRSAK